MINNATITNFQVHKSSHLQFHGGINVIAGTSDAGKSSVIRALLWLLTNKPAGDDFITWGTDGNTIVSIKIDDRTISKTRRNGKNTYKIDGNPYDATGTEMFSELLEATRIDEYNYQTQHQPYFLLQETSPGKVAEKINALVGLDIIDRVASNLRARLADRKKTSASISADIERQKKELALYNSLGEIEKLIVEVEDYETTITAINDEISGIRLIINRIKLNQRKLDELVDYTGIDAIIRNIRKNIDNQDAVVEQKAVLKKIINSLGVQHMSLDNIPDFTGIEDIIKEVRDNLSREKKIEDQRATLARCVASLRTLHGREADAEREFQEATTKYKEMVKKLGICPLCGGKLDAKKMLEKI